MGKLLAIGVALAAAYFYLADTGAVRISGGGSAKGAISGYAGAAKPAIGGIAGAAG